LNDYHSNNHKISMESLIIKLFILMPMIFITPDSGSPT
jgi:hypothetical protein